MHLKKFKLNNSAFTLVELLVVVALIIVLSGVVLRVLNVQGIRSKSRDSQRITDLKTIQNALELYFADNRTYPTAATWENIGVGLSSPSNLESALVPNYIANWPADPLETNISSPCSDPDSPRYNYRSFDLNSDTFVDSYILTAMMEIDSSNDIANGVDDNNGMSCDKLYVWQQASPCSPYTTVQRCYGVQNP